MGGGGGGWTLGESVISNTLPPFSLPLSCSGPSVFMVLTREDAISGWRALMGPVDPELAKQQDLNRCICDLHLTGKAELLYTTVHLCACRSTSIRQQKE